MRKSDRARSRLYDGWETRCEHTRVQQGSGDDSSTACIVVSRPHLPLQLLLEFVTPPDKATRSPSHHAAWCQRQTSPPHTTVTGTNAAITFALKLLSKRYVIRNL